VPLFATGMTAADLEAIAIAAVVKLILKVDL
jgi:hypothetical protein